MKPVIGVTAFEAGEEKERFALGRAYCEKLRQAGCVAVILPFAPAEDAGRLLSLCDGLLLSGGEDVDPACYGEEKHPACGPIAPERDRFELALLDAAQKRGLPVLGICRGVQVMNVYYGGTLVQDIESQLSLPKTLHSPGDYETLHGAQIRPQTRLGAILGAGDYAVNSSHHQCVKETPLTVAATDANGVVEAIEMPGERFVLGVQWHPERMADGRLFAALAEACKKGRE